MSDSGFAVRRKDTCGSLQDCGDTAGPFLACCPESSTCYRKANSFCCPEGVDCRDEVNENPRCADSDWLMYNNPAHEDGSAFFCCEQGLQGYNATKTGGSDGCAPLNENTEDYSWLVPEAQESASPSTSPEPSPDDEGGPPIGAIVGGTVGGVAALALLIAAAWWFRRKRRRAQDLPPPPQYEAKAAAAPPTPQYEAKAAAVPPTPQELEGERADDRPKELPGQHGASELAG